jgi:hypothetical protein
LPAFEPGLLFKPGFIFGVRIGLHALFSGNYKPLPALTQAPFDSSIGLIFPARDFQPPTPSMEEKDD